MDAALPAGTPFTVHSFSFPATVFNSGTSFKPGKSGADLVKHDGTNWKVYPEVLDLTNVGNVAVRLEIHRKIIRNGNQEHGGFTYVSVYAPPIVLFTNLQDSYCESALTHSISINVEGALKSTGPGLNELVGMFSFFLQVLGRQVRIQILVPQRMVVIYSILERCIRTCLPSTCKKN